MEFEAKINGFVIYGNLGGYGSVWDTYRGNEQVADVHNMTRRWIASRIKTAIMADSARGSNS